MNGANDLLVASTARLTALIADQERLLEIIRKEKSELFRMDKSIPVTRGTNGQGRHSRQKLISGYWPIVRAREGLMLGIRQPVRKAGPFAVLRVACHGKSLGRGLGIADAVI